MSCSNRPPTTINRNSKSPKNKQPANKTTNPLILSEKLIVQTGTNAFWTSLTMIQTGKQFLRT